MKTKLAQLRNRTARFSAAVAGVSLAGVGSAYAALPTGATAAFTTVQEDALSLIDLAWPAVIAITSGFIIIKLFKKAANKVG